MTEIHQPIARAAVLGAGVMGAQIAAHLTAAGIPTVLFDLPSDEGDRSQPARKGIEGLRKLKPPPLASDDLTGFIEPANFEDDVEKLAGCDFVIEAVVERMDIKKSLYERIAPHLHDEAILASNTSGLSIGDLAAVLPESLRGRFCGVHFFNPPRYMHLVELIPHAGTGGAALDFLESFLTTRLGKSVVRTKDTPNFIGNRVGVFAMLAVMHHAERLELGFDTVDALTGPAIGRPKSATFRLADVVGLDTMGHVIKTMQAQLEDDPWHHMYQAPAWLEKLIEAGALGQKSGAGVFRKEGKSIRVFDPTTGDYRDSDYSLDDEVKNLLAIKNPAEKLAALADSERPEAQFLWAIHRDLFHYVAVHLDEIADSAREIDLAMRWGYGWKLGPFESWQAAGWKQVAERIKKDIAAGHTPATAKLPAWVDEIEAAHGEKGSWSAADNDWSERSGLPVYDRQYQPPRLLGEATEAGQTVFESDDIRLWTLHDDVLIASFKTRMNVVDHGVIEGLHEAVRRAPAYKGLVIWQPEGPFSAGANLKAFKAAIEEGRYDDIQGLVEAFQRVNLALRYAPSPVVAAARGLALGGGLEVLLHCDAVAAHLESYVGLVEAGVGLIPAGGGLGTMAFRVHQAVQAGDSFALLQKRFEQIAKGKVSGSALEAMEMGYLRPGDTVVMHEHELLHAAHARVRAMDAAGYRPPLPQPTIPAAGDVGIATLRVLLANMQAGQFASDHDVEIANRIATVMCGGEIDRGTPVDENWLYGLEVKYFIDLAKMEPTHERIAHMLKTGKPLRN